MTTIELYTNTGTGIFDITATATSGVRNNPVTITFRDSKPEPSKFRHLYSVSNGVRRNLTEVRK